MARTLTLNPHYTPGPRKRHWRLWIPPSLSTTGKKQERYYTSEEEAKQAAQRLRQKMQDSNGEGLFELSPDQLSDAQSAFALLAQTEAKFSLVDAVRLYSRVLSVLQNHVEPLVETALQSYLKGSL
jgi:hypothetical protein